MKSKNTAGTTIVSTARALRIALLSAGFWSGVVGSVEVFAQTDPAQLEAQEEQAFKQAAALASPSVVRIETVGGLDRVGEVLTGTGPTTGVVVSADGYIISSAFNFASKPASILVLLSDGRRLTATQVANDKSKMLTLLKVDANDLVPAQAAPADSFKVGQWAIALGRTFDPEFPSISVGIVSALGRVWGKALQTDAKVSPVNYGGPLVDIEGRVLGILVPLSPQATDEVAGVEWYDSGIGFAIPLVDVYASLDRLKTGKDLVPGLLGVTFKGQNLFEGEPVLDRVRYGSPAQQAGFKPGDVVIELDGRKIERQAQARHALGNKYAEDKIAVTVKRGDETIKQDITLAAELVPYESAFLGILPERPVADMPAAPGVGVRMVYPDSAAAKAGIKEGQRIVKWQGLEVATPAALTDAVSRVRPGDKVKLTLQDEAGPREIDVQPGSLPVTVPAELRPISVHPAAAKPEGAAVPRTGRFTDTLAAHEHDYWAYVPEDYNPAYRYALVVWIHPPGDTMEAALTKLWKPICDERGIILLAPKAKQISGWDTNEQEFVDALTQQFIENYSVDPSRVILHSFSRAGQFAYSLAFKYRARFRGVAVAGAPLLNQPPDNEPDFRLQFYVVCGSKDPQLAITKATVTAVRNMKYSVVFREIEGLDAQYPDAALDELARWIDSIDRL